MIDIREKRPHMAGNALCLQCKHEWAAVAEIGEVCIDCPACGLHRGVWKGNPVPGRYWQCNCGGVHFFVDEEGCHCANCGLSQAFP